MNRLLHVYLEERGGRHPKRVPIDRVTIEFLAAGQGDLRIDQGWLHQSIPGFLPRPYGKLGCLGAFALQLRQRAVDTFMHQHAAIDSYELPGLPVHETQVAIPVYGESGVVAITVLDGRRPYRQHRRFDEVSHPMQSVGHLFLFDGQLVLVVHVLPLASGAHAVVGARRLDPPFRRLQHFYHRRRGVAPVHPDHLGDHLLPWYAPGHEDVRLLPLAHGFAQAPPGDQGQGYLLSFN